MTDHDLPEDDAARYVLGELTPAQRREFEARMAQSIDLRALVCELEDGAVALSMASPPRRAPQEVWARIEKTMGREQRRNVVTAVFGAGSWRHGWAAAAACLIGWLLYALWVKRPGTTLNSPQVASRTEPQHEIISQRKMSLADSHRPVTSTGAPQTRGTTNEQLQLLQARMREIAALHWQIAELTNQVAHLSQALTQQQALLFEPNRLRFFQLVPPSDGNTVAPATPVSTNLQRALFLAMARELGWQQSPASSEAARLASSQERPGNASNASITNQTGVDFVDFRSGSNTVTESTGRLAQSEPTYIPEPPTLASASGNAVPGFISGTNAFLAFDSTLAPAGSSLAFGALTTWGQYWPIGSTMLGTNPLVVAVRAWSVSGSGSILTVTATMPGGAVFTVGQ
ncbi:MAG: hypothetical protein DME19_02880, partial [Verrucomicrobia bacterium]